MEFSVEALHPHIDDRETVHSSVRHRLFNSLMHCGDVLTWYHAADDPVDERETVTSGKKGDAKIRNRKLAVPTRLLLEFSFRLGAAADRLTVRNLHLVGVDVETELPRQTLESDRQVRFAYPAEEQLMGLGVAGQHQRLILRLQALDGKHKFVVVGPDRS